MATQITSKSSTLDETSSATTKRRYNIDFLSEQGLDFIFTLNLEEIYVFLQEFQKRHKTFYVLGILETSLHVQSYLSFFFLSVLVGKKVTLAITNPVQWFGTKLLTEYSTG